VRSTATSIFRLKLYLPYPMVMIVKVVNCS
jgi:hypothetical protein